MTRFGGFLSGIAGVLVLGGYFVASLNKTYYLTLIGGILALVAAVISLRRTY
jgi:hypothetical protein